MHPKIEEKLTHMCSEELLATPLHLDVEWIERIVCAEDIDLLRLAFAELKAAYGFMHFPVSPLLQTIDKRLAAFDQLEPLPYYLTC